MTTIKGSIEREHYTVRLQSATNEIVADEPSSAGGKERGFSPEELLASSLAACTSITLRMYADRKDWDLEKVEVDIQLEKDAVNTTTRISREIRLTGLVTEEQKNRLLEIANLCPVHKILTHSIEIKTNIA